jgi:antitoxin ParD1/3/4
MAEIERVTVALPSPMADSMRAAVDSGEYATTSEVIRDALRLWEARRELRAREIASLKSAWDKGKASGSPKRLDIDAIITRAKKK